MCACACRTVRCRTVAVGVCVRGCAGAAAGASDAMQKKSPARACSTIDRTRSSDDAVPQPADEVCHIPFMIRQALKSPT